MPVAPNTASKALAATSSSVNSPGPSPLVAKFSPQVLQNLQQQFLLHTAMQLGNPNAAETTAQAIQALQLIQAMLPNGAAAVSSSQELQPSLESTSATIETPETGLSTSPDMQAPSFSLPLPTPGISAQLAELHAMFESNTNNQLASPPQAITPGPPSLSTSPNANLPTPELPSLSPSNSTALSSSGNVAFAIPNAPVSRQSTSHMTAPSAGLSMDLKNDSSSEFSEALSNTTAKRPPSLSVAIPVDNQYLPQLLAMANQRRPASGSSSSSSDSVAPAAVTGASAGAAAAANAIDQNKPLLTPGDFLMQATPGSSWLPAPSPLNIPLMTPGFATTPSGVPFPFPMFSPKQ